MTDPSNWRSTNLLLSKGGFPMRSQSSFVFFVFLYKCYLIAGIHLDILIEVVDFKL